MKAWTKVDQGVTGMLDSGAARSRRLKARLMALIASAVAVSALSAGSAQAATVTVFPDTPNPTGQQIFPFGIGSVWTPYAAFMYQNIPSFQLNTGDTLAFDLNAVNNVDIELDIALARTVSNGTIVEGEPFKQVVTNEQTPLNPRGDTTVGNFELRFTAQAPFSFPGGGLIIRFSDPSPSYAADATFTPNLVYGNSTDTSAFFVRRAIADADGVFPWPNSDTTNIGAFQVVTADPTVVPPANPLPPPGGTPPPPLTLDLKAKKQELRKKIKFSATANAGSTLVATGKAIKKTTKQLAADQKTTVKAKLKPKARKRLEEKLEEKGTAKVKVKGTARTQSGAAATDTVLVRLKD
jgi:hypothetical protein